MMPVNKRIFMWAPLQQSGEPKLTTMAGESGRFLERDCRSFGILICLHFAALPPHLILV